MKNYLVLLSVLISTCMQSQMSGNQVYGSNARYESSKSTNKSEISIDDNSLTVNVKVLLNNKADSFTLVLGTNEEAETVSECTTMLNKRIDGFSRELSKMNIKREDIYVDFISQIKVFDFSIVNNKADEFQKGFETVKLLSVIA